MPSFQGVMPKIKADYSPDMVIDHFEDAILSARLGAIMRAKAARGYPLTWRVISIDGGHLAFWAYFTTHYGDHNAFAGQCIGISRNDLDMPVIKNRSLIDEEN